MEFHPTVVRGNASEIISLCGESKVISKGVDSTNSSNQALDSGIALASKYRCVVAISGDVDYVTDGNRIIEIPNGTVMMTRVTALGCALNACIIACVIESEDIVTSVANVIFIMYIFIYRQCLCIL